MNGLRLSTAGKETELLVSDQADWRFFDCVAHALQSHLHGSWSAQLDGIDQRYWDLQRGEAEITLHLEHYVGITVFPSKNAKAPQASLLLFKEAYEFLANFEPSA